MHPFDPAVFPPAVVGRRTTVRERRIRLGDVGPSGAVRLDALACYLQDIAADDVDDAGIVSSWVLRRVALTVSELPQFGDDVELTTFCSGLGPRWAERRTTVRLGLEVMVESVAIWVYVDDEGRATSLPSWFFDRYGAVAERTVTSRLRHAGAPNATPSRPWPLRLTDFDVFAHVNNTIAWAAVEDERAQRAPNRPVRSAEMEYRAAIDPGDEIRLRSSVDDATLACWLTCGDQVRASAVLGFA